ncbi:4-hydroxy-tetrahydrodipicolinate reductase [Candidatus Tremblaya phenacola]|uniref:4-hydroxy-tetrahydrodipicolinate reductase n=1 Tax=Candidatus Tremblayella phenacoccinincola TaxID=1010676 RepID=A0A2G0V742_9PROT|nr:dihydrodipicolinate reductase C-terminal domain-containing protein [Candidatus Tremblaya phenacola]PHN16294.1 4-hydroxy-tetrahydrodipicolinate reductase [Candidatus Tremblaya phenacola]
MCKELTSLFITGINGRMGRQLVLSSYIDKLASIRMSIANNNLKHFNINLYKLFNIKSLAVIVSNNLLASRIKDIVLIDFTNPEASMVYLNICCLNKLNIVIGTTGFNIHQLSIIYMLSNYIAISYSANFSIGIALMLKLLRIAVLYLRENIDIQVIEVHHKKKRDVPSGTALMIRNYIDDLYIKPISFSSIRIGNIIGEHKVSFADLNECLSISHKVYDRMVFAKGAIKSSGWLLNKTKGLFNMLNVLGL